MPQIINKQIDICLTPYYKSTDIGEHCGAIYTYEPIIKSYNAFIELGTFNNPTEALGIYDLVFDDAKVGVLEVIDSAVYRSKTETRRVRNRATGQYEYQLVTYTARTTPPRWEFRLTLLDGSIYSTSYNIGNVVFKSTADYVFMSEGGNVDALGIKFLELRGFTTGYNSGYPFYVDYTDYSFRSGTIKIGIDMALIQLCTPSVETGGWMKISEDGCYDVYQRIITTINEDCSVDVVTEEDRRYSDILCPPTVTGVVKLETDPPGATIVIGNQELVSPATIDLEPGSYEVIISLDGHETITEIITVGIGETTPLAVSMEEAPNIVPKVIVGAVLSIGLYGLIRKLKR